MGLTQSCSQPNLSINTEYNDIRTHDAIRNMRDVRSQIKALNNRLKKEEFQEVIEEGEKLDSLMLEIEKVLYQTKLKSNQDMLNYPIMLNNKLAHVASLASM